MKRTLALIIILALILPCVAIPAHAAGEYTDVPSDSWASGVISDAADLKLMEGLGGGKFGYGQAVKRAEFVTMLCRMFDWQAETTATPTFSDVKASAWYYTYIETAHGHDAFDSAANFRPEEAITREEMAVMFVRALGYKPLAQRAESIGAQAFTDVTKNKGYIAVAYDIGMINGLGDGRFAPSDTALREHLAAMMVRVYEKLNAETDWLHGFYAFSSYPQRQVTRDMDAVSAGWSRMCLDESGVYLNTTSSGNNEWRIPDSYESITQYLDEGGTPLKLDVYMDNSAGEAGALLTNEGHRTAAVDAIVAELTRVYDKVGENPYSGVTIDFEGLGGEAQRAGFTAFLTQLKGRLNELNLSLYVAVQPVAEGGYYDGYDYKAIGEQADKVILMAHDYNATDLTGFEGSEYYKTTALTPLASVYHSLSAVTDPDTGVADKSKLAIAVSFSSIAFTVKDGLLVSGKPSTPSVETIYERLKQADTTLGWSDTYKNPWAQYTTEDGTEVFLWYEDARSITEKIQLAQLFGITGVSVWRIGTIPDYSDTGLGYDVWSAIK